MTAPDALVAAAEGGPSLVGAALRVTLALGAIVTAAIAWLWWQRRVRGPARRLEVLDRAVLARGASVALLRVDDRTLLVGVSTDGVRALADLDREDRGFDDELDRATSPPRLEAAR